MRSPSADVVRRLREEGRLGADLRLTEQEQEQEQDARAA